jgi:hypothetical protein
VDNRVFQGRHQTGGQDNCLADACPVTAADPCRTGVVHHQAEETGLN